MVYLVSIGSIELSLGLCCWLGFRWVRWKRGVDVCYCLFVLFALFLFLFLLLLLLLLVLLLVGQFEVVWFVEVV